eukprot:TRINITY_DN11686_c0_g1_i1.p1 TRINITY_DN11686_c0_g1~~TRINITY_DN11686_c0_g1_i1.p1  ORF type:complete len:200 (-),score=31.85 TRINITY_DN11686_c0_g1_i1:173-727(-)
MNIESLPQREPRKRRDREKHKQEEKVAEDEGNSIDAFPPPERELKYEYLDHPADIQIHSWGENMGEAFENAAIGMFNYMTPLEKVDFDAECTFRFEAEGHHMESLLFNFLDALLYHFHTEDVVCKDVRISLFNSQEFKIKGTGYGEKFDLSKHEQGTEIKAITYSNMQIFEDPHHPELYVIVDI